MRHGNKINHLSRTHSHRKAMLANMAASLIKHKRITTTLAKAKALRVYVEPLLTKSKDDTTHSRRVVFSYLQDKEAVNELFREISPKISERPGGYTRILKTGPRQGDNAEMCLIELVDYNENLLGTKETKTRKSRRSRRGAGTKTETAAKAAPAEKPVEAAPSEEPVAEMTDAPEAETDNSTLAENQAEASTEPDDTTKES